MLKKYYFCPMIETNGPFLKETLESLRIDDERKKQITINNAKSIMEKVIASYSDIVGPDQVGKDCTGVPEGYEFNNSGAIGLVYGRIQSGKTRAMITCTAMAFDNAFKIAMVMTSNINDLVNQTLKDFANNLKGVRVFTKDDELDDEIDEAKLDLQDTGGRILIILSKGTKSLTNISKFLKDIDAKNYPMVIFDDEGDQASLDTNTYKRSRSGTLTLEKSPINDKIFKLRKEFPASVYVSVTGTPQAVLLQSKASNNRPSFVEMLPFGEGYVGGIDFFNSEEPESNENHLIAIIPSVDQGNLLNPRQPFPIGLKKAILFYLLSACSLIIKKGYPSNANGYQFLCHPSLKNNEQDKAKNRISSFLTQLRKILMGEPDALNILNELQIQYEELVIQLGTETPTLEELKNKIKSELTSRKILVINSQNTKRRGIEYGNGLNFLIGGNTLGRGIAIPNLLVTYYVRTANTSQIDTMHQHARMFGYRSEYLKYTRLFTTKALYYRFRDIHYSDQALRIFIEKYKNSDPVTFPVEFSTGLRATRTNVLDINTTETIYGGMQIYPNYLKLPQKTSSYDNILLEIAELLGANIENKRDMEKKGAAGVVIPVSKAVELISQIKTKSKNAWNDKSICEVLEKICEDHDTVNLYFRSTERTIGENGFLSSGTISGAVQVAARAKNIPTLWIMDATANPDSDSYANEQFILPSIIVPNNLPNIFIFNKK